MSDLRVVEGDRDGAGRAGREGRAASIIGVLGAGTMGAGIAQLACRSGAQTLLFDPLPEALEKGRARIEDGLRREAAKGRLTAEQAAEAAERVSSVGQLSDLAPCELVIEAVPERIELKHDLYRQLSEIVDERCVLASNTSSLLVTAIAAAASGPERVVGMHFFNPAPVMRLLEVVAGEQSSEEALALALATGEAMGKTVIRASDGPGFLVNRCNRPFGLEALRLLAERISDVQGIDRICRMEGGFPMGPFELMDLVGVDVGFEISKSFYEQSFGEPRWRPSPIAARYVAAGLYGRKSGRGYYDYGDGPHRPEDPGPPEPAERGEGVIVIAGESVLAQQLGVAATEAGFEVRPAHAPLGDALPALFIDCTPAPLAQGAPLLVPPAGAIAARGGGGAGAVRGGGVAAGHGGAHLLLCAGASLSALDPAGSAVGFHVLPPFETARLVELASGESSSPLVAARAERFFAALGRRVEWVGDAPGLVLGRIVCQLINEAAFALTEGVGDARDIDLGMVLGLSHPRGPLQWADEIGLEHVLAVLDGLCSEYREERYRAAPVLRRLVREGRLGRAAGGGFHPAAR
ncbi:MAG TPA: 3-hydroxyacyl-CoA dehydrogenase NAD-binding domain-containing protein [Solirubrobacteraceae bacterium]|nr:3-hydroxyacyl-CoA dehydrogenase NAD-binding domain-containing protein [Solirubrobacteraceae bacterium]